MADINLEHIDAAADALLKAREYVGSGDDHWAREARLLIAALIIDRGRSASFGREGIARLIAVTPPDELIGNLARSANPIVQMTGHRMSAKPKNEKAGICATAYGLLRPTAAAAA